MRKSTPVEDKIVAESMRVRLTFTEDVLGGQPNDQEIHREYIASKAPDAPNRSKRIEEEIEAVGLDETIEKGMTVFPKMEDGTPFLYDYQIRGFFKSAAAAFYAVDKKSLPAYKSKIDKLVFIKERKIPFVIPEETEIGSCQRPLRAQTAQGERTALANSESISAGTIVEFTVQTMKADMMDKVCDWLDYGQLCGIGQWRNSGKGRFVWEEIDA